MRTRTHPSSLSFVQASQPAEPEPTALERYHAAHPQEREVFTALLAEFHEKFQKFQLGVKPIMAQFVGTAECAREIGIVLVELCDQLPGKKLTRDFYEQIKPHFQDGMGCAITFEQLEWFISIARKCPEPLDLPTALRQVQPMLLASGDPAFELVSPPVVKQRIPPADEFGKLTSWFENPELADWWTRLKQHPKYFPDGHLRPDLKARLAEELKPTLAVIEELRQELGI